MPLVLTQAHAPFCAEPIGRFADLLRTAWEGRLAPLYNYIDDLPELAYQGMTYLPPKSRAATPSCPALYAGRGRGQTIDVLFHPQGLKP